MNKSMAKNKTKLTDRVLTRKMLTEIYHLEEEQSVNNIFLLKIRFKMILPRKSFRYVLSLDKRPHQCHYQLEIRHESYFPRRFPVIRRFFMLLRWRLISVTMRVLK